jgi:NDP-sugar pyrophosphorylase family protein
VKGSLQVVILAGGMGTRLGSLTRDIPKPLQDVAGKPYLHYQLVWLGGQGFHKVLLLTGYLGEQIEQAFGNGEVYGLDIRYSKESEPLGTGGALRHGMEMLDEAFILLYGDSFLPISLPEVEQRFLELDREGMLVVFDNRIENTTVPSNVALDESGDIVLRYAKETEDPDLQFVEAGVLCFRRSVVNRIPAETKISLEEDIYPQMIEENALAGFVTQQRFYDIGTTDRLRKFKEVINDYFPHTLPD